MINESQLSATLGISRTPLREALASLESELLVRSEHERGFFVAPLSSNEVREIYPIGRELDLLALRTIRYFGAATLRELKRCNRAFLAAKRDPELARRHDTEFHGTLVNTLPGRPRISLRWFIMGCFSLAMLAACVPPQQHGSAKQKSLRPIRCDRRPLYAPCRDRRIRMKAPTPPPTSRP